MADTPNVRQVLSVTTGRALLACRFHPSGNFVVAGGMNDKVTQVALNGDKPGARLDLDGPQSWVAALAFDRSGSVLFAGDYAGQLLAYKFPAQAGRQPAWVRPAHSGWLRALAVSPDGKLVATCGNDKLVRLWTAADGEAVAELAGHDCDVYNVAFHPGGQLASADLKGVVKVWDAPAGRLVRELDARALFGQQGEHRLGGVRSMAFHPDGSKLACGGLGSLGSTGDGTGTATVVLIDWATGRPLVLVPHEEQKSFVTGLAFTTDGKVLGATGGFDQGALLLWRGDQPKSVFKWKMPASGWGADYHAASRRLAVAHHSGAVNVYAGQMIG